MGALSFTEICAAEQSSQCHRATNMAGLETRGAKWCLGMVGKHASARLREAGRGPHHDELWREALNLEA